MIAVATMSRETYTLDIDFFDNVDEAARVMATWVQAEVPEGAGLRWITDQLDDEDVTVTIADVPRR